MKEPERIPLTDAPKNKEPKRIPLTTPSNYDIEMIDHLWVKNEDNKQDNSESISELDSLQGN
jgi:hypothetical protein